MKKYSALLITVLFLWNVIPSTAATFSDLDVNHKNYEAISTLQDRGILKGYPDGTFRPDQRVNRAEFLKIAMIGSGVSIFEYQPTPFPDIHPTDWYAPYVSQAYHAGWIKGYPNGTFKPEQTINKAEALKIIGAIQGWQLPTITETIPFNDTGKNDWFTPYVAYAKEHNLLAESGFWFSPTNLMSRADISEIVYRGLSLDEKSIDEEVSTEDENKEDFTEDNNAKFAEISKTFFNDISLDETLPNTFYKNEIYVVSGEITHGNYDSITAILKNERTNESKSFIAPVENDNFSLTLFFAESGEHSIGIIPGKSGKSKAAEIQINSGISDKNVGDAPNRPDKPSLKFSDSTTQIHFAAPNRTLKKFSFNQNSKTVTFYSRQDLSELNIPYENFSDFSERSTKLDFSYATLSSIAPLSISSDYSEISSHTFTATTHQFSDIEKNYVSVTLPETLKNIEKISFTGTAKTELRERAMVIKPDGLVDEVSLSSNKNTGTYQNSTVIKDGARFTFNYTPERSGTYIIAVYDKEGVPIINHPVYVKTGIPLLPDFFDLFSRSPFNGSLNLNSSRQELLKYINDIRKKMGLNNLSLDDNLNLLAQSHSDDMAENDYFSHYDKNGDGPNDRRLSFDITTSVAENIALDTSIESAHMGLLRSASHRDTIINPDWKKIGIGITLKNKTLYISEEFSVGDYSASDLLSIKSTLFTAINNLRDNQGVSSLTGDNDLSTASEYINDELIANKMSLNDFTSTLLNTAINIHNISGQVLAIGRSSGTWSKTLDSLLSQENDSLTDNKWDKIGIDIQPNQDGLIQTILLLSGF